MLAGSVEDDVGLLSFDPGFRSRFAHRASERPPYRCSRTRSSDPRHLTRADPPRIDSLRNESRILCFNNLMSSAPVHRHVSEDARRPKTEAHVQRSIGGKDARVTDHELLSVLDSAPPAGEAPHYAGCGTAPLPLRIVASGHRPPRRIPASEAARRGRPIGHSCCPLQGLRWSRCAARLSTADRLKTSGK